VLFESEIDTFLILHKTQMTVKEFRENFVQNRKDAQSKVEESHITFRQGGGENGAIEVGRCALASLRNLI